MQTIPDMVRALQAHLVVDQELSRFIAGRFVIQLDGPGGGEWVLGSRGVGCSEESECRLQLSSSDFSDIVSGALNPQEAFLRGRLRLAGDADLALKFVRLWPRPNVRL